MTFSINYLFLTENYKGESSFTLISKISTFHLAGHPALRKILSRISEIAKNPYTTSLPPNTLEHLASELPEDSGLALAKI